MAMYLVDGVRLFRRVDDLDRDSKCNCLLYDSLALKCSGSTRALYASGARYSSGKGLLVVIGADLDLRRRADSTLPVPADGAGGLRLS